ncbi:hydrogenase maturation nickel metallochaperone HypA [Streptomyces sp. NBC_00199]|uniref:hydrogenase maturation nickel metallochaperone HypA/HybF n=1 Tax=Streptomyces sp. NBC_00199 TaxID=2975678 RepID=UPI002256032E|nr:hydrogenase maturation nickel metallochaperone HypA [Streptomyces sp. NBC_00199]MCX5262721.1 hydrogenase maturation nickel metallochaperone HypA [Streptomyces sp. NBC_00199]
MHEMSVALAVVDQVAEAAARSAGVTAVRSVRLQVGELAGVVPDALAFSFELACAGTVLEGAELITEAVPGRARCTPCAHEWAVGMPPRLTCPACGATHTELLAGRELRIVDVHWEDGLLDASTREPISEER